jgi:hypothetical protein
MNAQAGALSDSDVKLMRGAAGGILDNQVHQSYLLTRAPAR